MPLAEADRLIFIRHGETDWNRDGLLQGQRDIGLNDKGRAQAHAAALQIAGIVQDRPDFPCQASPLQRTVETMRIVRATLGLAPPQAFTTDARLMELTFGRWEGLSWRAVRQKDPIAARQRHADKWGFVPPGGESYAMLAARVEPWLQGVAGDILVVAHGGIARVLFVLIAGMDPGLASSTPIFQGRVLMFQKGAFRWL
jgi:broad specificity phosphatase PhoE